MRMRLPKIDLTTLHDGGFFARVIKHEFKPDQCASDEDEDMDAPINNNNNKTNNKKPLHKFPKRLKRKVKAKLDRAGSKNDEIKSEADDEADEP